jgi:hypothetical protein
MRRGNYYPSMSERKNYNSLAAGGMTGHAGHYDFRTDGVVVDLQHRLNLAHDNFKETILSKRRRYSIDLNLLVRLIKINFIRMCSNCMKRTE